MQVSCLPPGPPSDVERMKTELTTIHKLMPDVNETTCKELKAAILIINDIILSLDNSNDFFKIGGFSVLMPLLSCSNSEIVAATSELIADLCQNNKFCQAKVLDFNLLPQLLMLLTHSDAKVCSKGLYAVSCLCRHNENALKHLEISDIVPLLKKILLESDERLTARSAFFLSYLTSLQNFRESFYQADMVCAIAKLLNDKEDSSSEHLLNALLAQVTSHKQSRIQCRRAEYNLKDILLSKIKLYESKSEYQESKEYCSKILDTCFYEQK